MWDFLLPPSITIFETEDFAGPVFFFFFFLIMHSSQFCAENTRNYLPNIKGKRNSERENWGEKGQGYTSPETPPQKNKGAMYSRLALKSRVFHLSVFVL